MDRVIRYRIGPDDRIRSVDAAFESFAEENRAPDLGREAVGTLLWEHVTGAGVEAIYRQFLERVREDGRTIHVPFRCDAPDLRRFMSLVIAPGEEPGSVTFEARLVRAEAREPVSLWDVDVPRDEETLLSACAWCKQVRVDESWVDAEEAVTRLGLFAKALVPDVTHGMCDECARQMDGLLKTR